MTLQEEYRAQREKLATGYGFGDFIDMFAAPTSGESSSRTYARSCP